MNTFTCFITEITLGESPGESPVKHPSQATTRGILRYDVIAQTEKGHTPRIIKGNWSQIILTSHTLFAKVKRSCIDKTNNFSCDRTFTNLKSTENEEKIRQKCYDMRTFPNLFGSIPIYKVFLFIWLIILLCFICQFYWPPTLQSSASRIAFLYLKTGASKIVKIIRIISIKGYENPSLDRLNPPLVLWWVRAMSQGEITCTCLLHAEMYIHTYIHTEKKKMFNKKKCPNPWKHHLQSKTSGIFFDSHLWFVWTSSHMLVHCTAIEYRLFENIGTHQYILFRSCVDYWIAVKEQALHGHEMFVNVATKFPSESTFWLNSVISIPLFLTVFKRST